MNKIELLYSKIVEDGADSMPLRIEKLFIKLFNSIPHMYRVGYTSSGELWVEKDQGCNITKVLNFEDTKLGGLNTYKFLTKLVEKYSITILPILPSMYSGSCIYIGEEGFIIIQGGVICEKDIEVLCFYALDEAVEGLLELVPEFEIIKNPIYYYVSVDSRGNFGCSEFKLTVNENVSLDNYNDDIPYQEYLNFCNKKECGLALMHGEPGTGKTTLIKKLITNSDTPFYILDASLLSNITQSSFIDFLMDECENSVFILEDCEKLLVNRNSDYNPWLGTLLNLTDGMLGEGLNIKFICTFNAPMKSIDPALLRKGRLKVNYEFKPLAAEKVEKLAKQLHLDIHGSKTLAEIYTVDYTDTTIKEKPKSIGFR